MTLTEYLSTILESQTLASDGEELQQLQKHRKAVEDILRAKFSKRSPTIRYGGSVAKKTLIKVAYDLDIICYFEHDDNNAGESLREIYDNVKDALSKDYSVEPKTSALRLKGKGVSDFLLDFHVDVVPGRFTDEQRSDCYIYQASGEKSRLKTNIETHIKHIRDSGLTEAIRVMKLWNVQNGIGVKTFVLELLVVEALKKHGTESLGDQFVAMLTRLRDDVYGIHIEDPANPTGNDLSGALDDGVRLSLESVATSTLSYIQDNNFPKVFGNVASAAGNAIPLVTVVSSVNRGTRPWAH